MTTKNFFLNNMQCYRWAWKSLVLITVLFLLNSCQPSGLTRIYVETSFLPNPINKVLIIGMIEKESIRKTFEVALVRKFIGRGVEAIPSHKLISSIKGLDKETVVSKIEGMGFDSVLVTWPIKIGQEKIIIPLPDDRDRNSLDDFFTRYHSVVGSDYQLDLDWLYLENRLYETKGGRLVWASHTKEFDFNSNQLRSTIDLFSRIVILDLAKKNLIH